MDELVISPLQEKHIPEAIEVLTLAYTNNPLHAAVFGRDDYGSNRIFLGAGLNRTAGLTFVAELDGAVVGVIRITKHPQPVADPVETQPEPTPPPLPEAALKLIKEWMAVWESVHLRDSHYHFGPVAVLPKWQHQHVGSKLMEHCCRILDRDGEIGYLETETTENVKFYSRFGFQVLDEFPVLGLPNWSMKRLPVSR